MLFLLVRT